MTASDVRTAHKLLDRVSQGRAVLEEEISLIRSFLPEPPAQKTLEEIAWDMHFAWSETFGNDWKEELFGELEPWLSEQHNQLRAHLEGVKSQAHPALPAGMRLATHPEYGLCVVSPTTDEDGERRIFYLSAGIDAGADSRWVPVVHLAFIDPEPAKPAHPEFLETEADYHHAPEGTVVARDGLNPWVKEESVWVQGSAANATVFTVPCLKGPRRVLRWGNE